ncbi:hypothetical protein CHGG_07841 [Chaetomium globosum CBS 148.51]|uniref:Gastric mucin-like protein n=1 Tax=Chaetomium globosum (strain ATCC 6205 / CBS 148.51 / DSM 1962 / NBRC 6347 / NRRL 1970) TaxID=306901 RepID=Q2GW13_CHAGB|nr:uncharacterized protein CHGG_07841 [Chaetomium globosum CBS 148.51]EAQ86588.1 hypothetical protein CHGG_07841 [Chaetomium globosum CBS 148.51]
MAVPIPQRRPGHIVALEGPSELVSTQLRLLPASPQILVLPSLQNYLKDLEPDTPFDPRELIRRYRTASLNRHTEALEFLRPSASTGEKRLVFLHGGTMSAQVSCLSTIMEHEPDGDIEEAHATVAMDDDFEPTILDRAPSRRYEWGGYMNDAGGDSFEDRIIRAMRAADALDKETEFLQPLTPDMDLTVKLVDIPPSKKRLSSTVAESSEILRGPRPPSPSDGQTRLYEDPAPRVSLDATAAPRKPPLRIHIPSSPIAWAGDAALGGNRSNVYHPQGQVPGVLSHKRSRTAESNLSPKQQPTGHNNTQEDVVVSELPNDQLPPNGDGNSNEPPTSRPPDTIEQQPFESVLPLLEDLVVFFTPETPDKLQNFVFRRLSEGYKTPRQSISVSGPLVPHYDAFQGTSHLAIGDGQDASQGQPEDGDAGAVVPWTRKDLVHGLPTPNHSPNPLDASSVATPLMDTRFYSISVGQETAASIQNFLRSFLGSQFPLQDRRFSAADGADFPAETGLWRALECDGQAEPNDGERRLDLIMAVGSESGVTKNRLSEIIGQIEKLGFKTSGLSRSGRLDIRYLIANAMQAFTAQPLTKQTQSNPFADRALLAALIIPHLETYLATHPDVRFLLIEYPSEHLPTVLALQTLIGTEMMKVVGIIDGDVSTPVQQSLSAPDTNRRSSEGFRSLNRRGSRKSGAFVGPCSFSKANFLLASSATGFETAAFVAAIRESLISISDYYMPERPLYKHPEPQSPPRKSRPSLSVSTESADVKPHSEKAPLVSTSTLITPPSSPTESSSTPAHPPHHVNPRSIPPRSSSSATASPPGRGRRSTRASFTDDFSSSGRVQWGEVNYDTPPVPPLPAAHATTNQTIAKTTYSSRHQKKHSDPLSPRGIAPPSALTLPPTSTAVSNGGQADNESIEPSESPPEYTAAAPVAVNHNDDEDYYSDDSEPDPEERRLMPLYLRRREEIERGRSSKAMRWLGLV